MLTSLNAKYLLQILLLSFACFNIHAKLFYPQTDIHADYVTVLDRKSGTTIPDRHGARTKRFAKVPGMKEKVNVVGKSGVESTEYVLLEDSNNIAFVFWKHHRTDSIFILTCENASTVSTGKLSNKGCHSYSNLYRSDSLGASFNRSDKVEPFTGHWLHSIYLSPLAKDFIIITDYKNKTIFITSDEGKTYEKVKLDFSPTFMQFHPSKKEIISAFDNTRAGKNSLWWSIDSGKTWRRASSNIKNYFWKSEKLDEHGGDGFYFERLEVNQKPIDGKLVSGLYFFLFPKERNVGVPLVRSTNLVQDSVYVGDEFVLMQKVSDKKVYVIRPKYQNVPHEIVYQLKNSKAHIHYIVISSDNNEVLLGVMHPDQTVTLYMSDHSGVFFKFLIEDVISEPLKHASRIPKMDFHRAKGMKTTYIVNTKKNGTLISLDKGHTWNILNYGKVGIDGDRIDASCKQLRIGKCQLNLYLAVEKLYSDYTAPLLSKESAPGILIAQGRISVPSPEIEDLTHAPHDVYISTDGGRYWRQALDSFYGYAMLDHGNAIAATPLQFTVRQEIKLSTNYGYHWYDFMLTHRYSRIAAIITDSTAKTLIVNVFGFLHQQPLASDVKGNQWVVWKFNFTRVIPRVCEHDDYIRYFPTNDCILGDKFGYLRSIRFENETARCFSPPDHDIQPRHKSCACTKADFECDDEYIRLPVGPNSYKCQPIYEELGQRHQVCDKDGFYIKTKGYKKLQGDKCSGGVENQLTGTKEKCDNISPVAKIRASRSTIGINDFVRFTIVYTVQSAGTKYFWIFGDGNNMTGSFREVESVRHSFKTVGHYTVKLVAQRKRQTYTDSVVIIVLDRTYHNAFIHYKAPIILNEPVNFQLQKMSNDGESLKELPHFGNIRFLWSFQGVYQGNSNSVTVPFTFKKTGTFQVEVQVITPINSQTIVRMVRVYKSAYAIDFTFSSYLALLNTGTHTWLNDFMYKFKDFIKVRYNVDNRDERLLTEEKLSASTRARLLICDFDDASMNSTDYKTAEALAHHIIADINENKPVLPGYRSSDIHVIKAESIGFVHAIGGDENKTDKKSNVWIYIVVMLIILIAVVALTLFIRSRRKGGCLPKRLHIRRDKNDIMQKKLVFNTDEDCVGLEGPDLPQYKD